MQNSNRKDSTGRSFNFLLPKMSKALILLFILFFSFSNAFAKNNFVPGISDLPVPINFHLIKNSTSDFIANNGRIIEASFKGKGEKDNIIDFYEKTLPALGWKQLESLNFSRDKEHLNIKIEILTKGKRTYPDILKINFSSSVK